jgi:hypothetical protein
MQPSAYCAMETLPDVGKRFRDLRKKERRSNANIGPQSR